MSEEPESVGEVQHSETIPFRVVPQQKAKSALIDLTTLTTEQRQRISAYCNRRAEETGTTPAAVSEDLRRDPGLFAAALEFPLPPADPALAPPRQ